MPTGSRWAVTDGKRVAKEAGRMHWRRKLKLANSITSTTDRLELAAAAESFLTGAYEQHLRGNDQLIPGWTRLNGVAHGDLDVLKRMAKTLNVHELPSVAEHSDKAWRVAQAVMAADLVELVMGSTKLLERIQRRVLIPLEFCLMEEDNVTALELAALTRAALRSRIV
jgi:hypothetical protein